MVDNEKREEPGFEIGGVVYPIPSSFRLVDPVLVREVTGMSFPEFAEMIGDDDLRQDPAVMAGMIAVAVWQQNPRWPRAKVVRFVQEIPLDSIDVTGGEEGDTVPPAVAPETEPEGGHASS